MFYGKHMINNAFNRNMFSLFYYVHLHCFVLLKSLYDSSRGPGPNSNLKTNFILILTPYAVTPPLEAFSKDSLLTFTSEPHNPIQVEIQRNTVPSIIQHLVLPSWAGSHPASAH